MDSVNMSRKRKSDDAGNASMAKKQLSHNNVDEGSQDSGARPSSTIIGISRSIAACQRCRQKKTKCDQKFPSCAKCEKAGVACVGLDPATGRQVPRSYVIYLEDKVNELEALLKQNGIDSNVTAGSSPLTASNTPSTAQNFQLPMMNDDSKDQDSSIKSSMNLAVPSTSNHNGVSFYIGDSSGISFAKLLFTAVNFHPSSINDSNSITTRGPLSDSVAQKVLDTGIPSKQNAEFLIKIFFEQSNTQLPIMHREYFINNYFKPIYGNLSPNVKLASNYTQMNLDNSPIDESETWFHIQISQNSKSDNVPKKFKKPLFFLNLVFAIATSVNLLQYKSETSNSYRSAGMKFVESIYASPDRLECLQGLLLLTLYSIMRPSQPGVWYVLGTTLRLVIDLGLHTEKMNKQFSPFVKDLRRRLFWCAYSLDRQICFYLGRPFGIPEESISTQYPVELDDCLVNVDDQQDYRNPSNSLPTYKLISINFLKIRRIQSEIIHVLYFSNSVLPRYYSTLNEWKSSINARLETWFKTIPLKTSRKANCDFNFEFFKLNYFHTKLLLYGITPKNDKLDQKSVEAIFEYSKRMILCYWDFFETKSINYTWATVHNLFFASTSFFYSIFYSNTNLIQVSEFEEVVDMVKKILSSLNDNCEAASPCVETIEIIYLAMTKLKFTNIKNENEPVISSKRFDDIDRFFLQLNNPEESTTFKDFQYSSVFDDSTTPGDNNEDQFGAGNVGNVAMQNSASYQSLSTPPAMASYEDSMIRGDREQQRVFDVMSKVSMDTIWDQFLGNGGF